MTLRELDHLYQLMLTINYQKLPPGNSGLNSTVQPETTFMLSHKRAICGEATCTRVFNSLTRSIFFFRKRKYFDPPGLSNKRLSRSGLIKKKSWVFCCIWCGRAWEAMNLLTTALAYDRFGALTGCTSRPTTQIRNPAYDLQKVPLLGLLSFCLLSFRLLSICLLSFCLLSFYLLNI